jgi:hypothetical protein
MIREEYVDSNRRILEREIAFEEAVKKIKDEISMDSIIVSRFQIPALKGVNIASKVVWDRVDGVYPMDMFNDNFILGTETIGVSFRAEANMVLRRRNNHLEVFFEDYCYTLTIMNMK